MRKCLLALVCIAGLCISAEATTITVKDHNFAIDIPDTWVQVNVSSSMIVVAARDAEKEKSVVVGAAKIPDNERLTSSRDMFEGVKKGLTDSSWQITNEHEADFAGLVFHALVAHGAGTKTALAYVTSAGDQMYSIQLYSNVSDASNDPEIVSIIKSFRLLSNQPANESAAYRLGYETGRYLVYIIVIVVVMMAVGGKLKRKPREAPRPPPASTA